MPKMTLTYNWKLSRPLRLYQQPGPLGLSLKLVFWTHIASLCSPTGEAPLGLPHGEAPLGLPHKFGIGAFGLRLTAFPMANFFHTFSPTKIHNFARVQPLFATTK